MGLSIGEQRAFNSSKRQSDGASGALDSDVEAQKQAYQNTQYSQPSPIRSRANQASFRNAQQQRNQDQSIGRGNSLKAQLAYKQSQIQSQRANKETIQKQLTVVNKKIVDLNNEIKEFTNMLYTQVVPVGVTAGATVFEVMDGGTLSLFVTGFAIFVRFYWYHRQSLAVKVWLRLKSMKQAILASVISMIPFVGVALQPDLISTAIVTPMQSSKELRSLLVELFHLKRQQKSLTIQLRK